MIPGIKKRVVNFHDLLMYVAIGRKHLRLMILLMCAMMLVGTIWYVFARPVYWSRALIRVNYVAQPLDTNTLYRDGRVAAVIRELTGPDNVVRTAHALGLGGGFKDLSLKNIFKLRAAVNAEKNVELESYCNSFPLVSRWPQELVKQYLQHRQDERNRQRDMITAKYLPEIKEVTEKISEKRGEKFDLKNKLNVTEAEIKASQMRSLPADLVAIIKRIEAVGRVKVRLSDPDLETVAKLSLIDSVNDKSTALHIGDDIQVTTNNNLPQGQGGADANGSKEGNSEPAESGSPSPLGKTDVVITPPMVKSAQPWEDLEKQREQIKNAINQAAQIYKPGHRKMVELNKDLKEIDRRLDTELKVASDRLSYEYTDLLNKQKELEAKTPEYDAAMEKLTAVTEQSKMFNASNLPWVRYYSQMKKELDALDYLDSDKERVDLDYRGLVDYHEDPVSPSKGKIFLASMFLGLMFAIGIPFLVEYLDHTLSNLEQVESAFQLRGLGIVPKLPEYGATAPLLDGQKTTESNLVENFRVIRTNLLSMGALTKAPHVIMVTSAMPKEGKTVVSSNLAISFAQTGTRTLLVDTDLRRGRLHRLFGYRKSPGLSDVLLGECKLDDAIRPTTHENLTIVSAGKHVDAGTELLCSEKFREIMITLRERFDRIVIDTPPVLGLSETSVLQTFVDGVLFVIWSGNTPIRTMKAAIEMLQANGANFYGFVLNRLDLNATTNYYQYYYYSHDYYYSTTHAIENT